MNNKCALKSITLPAGTGEMMKLQRKLIPLLFFTACMLFLSPTAFAGRSYLVEVVVFHNSGATTGEKWEDDAPQLNPRKLKRAQLPSDIMKSFDEEPKELSKSKFSRIVQRIRNNPSRKVILSTRWVQAVGTPATTTIARITTRTDLNNAEEVAGSAAVVSPIADNSQNEYTPAMLDGFVNFYLAGQYTIEADIRYSPEHRPSILDENPLSGPVSYRVYEKRRIKSGEMNYYDHPKIGMVLRVTPVVPVAAATAATAK
jgi:hypothetical protein